MKRLALALALISVVMAPARAEAPARTVVQTDDLSAPVAEAIAAQPQKAGSRVLLVFDIDNTLLTMPQYLGSDRWFNYNAELISVGRNPDFATMDQLIAAQAMLFGVSTMDLTQPDIPELIARARAAGVDIMLLSARGPDFYDISVRELRRTGVRWQAPVVCAFFLCSPDGRYDAEALQSAFTQIGTPTHAGGLRPIIIADGVMLAAGQNKGAMLDLMVTALGKDRISRIVFVDDSERNVSAVATSQTPVPISIYHYRRVPTAVSETEARAGSKQYRLFLKSLCQTVRSALCPLEPAKAAGDHR